MNKFLLTVIVTSLLLNLVSTAHAQVLNKDQLLKKYDFWDNRDFKWYKDNIPFFESPDSDIDLTYYYRWELITKHLVYGSPQSGYAITEFIDRPWWSGAFGAISCAVGHQLYELRWFKDRKYHEDFSKYWFQTPNAQPRNYSTWLADAIWQGYKVHYNNDLILSLLPAMIENYKGWEAEHYVPAEGLFAWDGMHDGMETNINSRQTPNWFSGAPGYRPTLNSYMWADAQAIKQIALIKGDQKLADYYQKKSDTLKINLQSKCWDPKRNFFFHRYQNDEEGGIKANTLTYQSGKYEGSEHGREEIGFVPWSFNMLDRGYEKAWSFLMDTAYFYSDRGPYTVEKNDPMFKISKYCCEWSGNSWPFATTQTLKAMANLLKNYQQEYVNRDDYFKLLKNYSLTHRKDGSPYIAEACHPVTGSWSGHDVPYHSEHYFHSGYIDLIIADLIGLEPQNNDSITINPLVPKEWEYFCLEDVAYHGNLLTILWDRDGKKYKRGNGFMVFLNGKTIAESDEIEKLTLYIPLKTEEKPAKEYNVAVNNGVGYFPRAIASYPGIKDPFTYLNDGQYWYHSFPPNRWSTLGDSNSESAWCGIDFGNVKEISEVKIYFIDDDSLIHKPVSYHVEYWDGKQWQKVKKATYAYVKPQGRMANSIKLHELKTSKLRVVMIPQKGYAVGVSEFEAWSPVIGDDKTIAGNIDNLAFYSKAKIKASYTSDAPEFDLRFLNDGIINKGALWSSHRSPNAQDTLTIDLGQAKLVNTAHLFFYEDVWEQKPPKDYKIEYFNENESKWFPVQNTQKKPEIPVGNSLNLAIFNDVNTSKIRIIVIHQKINNYTALYELELFGNN